MAVSTRQKRSPDAQSGLFKKIAASVLIAGPFLAAGGYGVTESDLPGWASGVLLPRVLVSRGILVLFPRPEVDLGAEPRQRPDVRGPQEPR